jgi:hypothetical protein
MSILGIGDNGLFFDPRQTHVVDFLQKYLSAAEIPPFAGIKETSVGSVSYAIGGITLSNVRIPNERVHLSFTGKILKVKA